MYQHAHMHAHGVAVKWFAHRVDELCWTTKVQLAHVEACTMLVALPLQPRRTDESVNDQHSGIMSDRVVSHCICAYHE